MTPENKFERLIRRLESVAKMYIYFLIFLSILLFLLIFLFKNSIGWPKSIQSFIFWGLNISIIILLIVSIVEFVLNKNGTRFHLFVSRIKIKNKYCNNNKEIIAIAAVVVAMAAVTMAVAVAVVTMATAVVVAAVVITVVAAMVAATAAAWQQQWNV